MKGILAKFVIRSLVNLHILLLSALPKRSLQLREGKKTILLTGTFYSENWIMNHLRPLLKNENSKAVYIVSYFPIKPLPKLHVILPPKAFKIFGRTAGRLLFFCLFAFKVRPDLIGGFHILMNGLVVAVLGRVLNVPSLYVCGGGPREVAGGGYFAGNASLTLKEPDYALEQRLLKAISHIHHVVAMGQRTVNYFKQEQIKSQYHIIPGGIDQISFPSGSTTKEYDLIFVGRLAPVKRLDLFLKAVAILKDDYPFLSAVIVGCGELDHELKNMVDALDIRQQVRFAGHQSDVACFLRKSKVFVLTSDSEGLSLAMMEALTCGLPCVVSDVGELGEIIENNVNGFLVKDRTGEAFARSLNSCLADSKVLKMLSEGAERSASKFSLENTARKWDDVLNWNPNIVKGQKQVEPLTMEARN